MRTKCPRRPTDWSLQGKWTAVLQSIHTQIRNKTIGAIIAKKNCGRYLLIRDAELLQFLYPLVGAVVGIAVRYTCSRITGDIKDKLGRGVKRDLREKVYNKILRLGVKTTDGMSMAGLTQVSLEGVEQLDIYFSSYTA